MKQNNIFIYSWFIDEIETDYTKIRAYGLDENNKNICLHIDDFTPYVYIELPTFTEWTERKAQLLGNKLDEILGESGPLKKALIMKHKLYGAHIDSNGKKKLFPYLFCSFANRSHINRVLIPRTRKPINVQGIGTLRLKVHESDADPILQLVSCKNISSIGWSKFIGEEIDELDKITLCDHEYKVKWKGLSKLDKNTVVQPLIMGFDIEVNSMNPAMMPKAKNPGDKAFQISCVFNREGTETNESYLLTLGQAENSIVGENITIRMFETEAGLLIGFTELVREKNPNIISGYNILGFDIQYMIDRAKFNLCIGSFNLLGFHKYNHANEKKIKWSSSAFKNQEFDYLDAEGRIFVDLLPLIQRDYKFSNYKLKTVSEEILKDDTKDDLSIRKLFKYYKIGVKRLPDGTYSKRSIKAMSLIGKYCMKDSELCVKLMQKMQTWIGLTEFAKTVNTGIFSLYTQGQQIKVYSQIYAFCLKNNIVVEKDVYIVKEGERFAGAHVFPPVPGIYYNVLPFDFASLYPTIMIAYNIDYSSWVTDEQIPDSKCNVLKWMECSSCIHDPKVIKIGEITKYIDKEKKYLKELRTERDKKCNKLTKLEFIEEINKKNLALKPYIEERSKMKKTILKNPLCGERYYRFYKEIKGVVPTILDNLLDARRNTRMNIKKNKKIIQELESENAEENKEKISDLKILNSVLDKRQLSYKVSCNSAYGAYGVRKGYLPFMCGAQSVTYMGRTNIEKVADVIKNKYGGNLVYGDSVTGDTPILCKINNKIVYRTIDNLPHSGWNKYRDEKEDADPDNIEVWTENGFTKIKKIIRHKTTKELFRVLTHTGIVDVTEDHGLLDSNANKISPKEIKVGSELLTSDLPIDCKYTFTEIDVNLAFIMGLFYADGSCGYYVGTNGQKVSTWTLNNTDRKLLEKCESILNNSKKDTKYELNTLSFKILETMNSSHVLKLVPTGKGIVTFDKIWTELFYDKEKYKKVPDEILWSNTEVRQSFLDGYYAGDGDKDKHGYYRFDNKGKIGASGLYFLASSLGYNVSINTRKDKPNVYRLTCTTSPQRKKENVVKKIESLGNTEQYVYDLETENHHFSAGIGRLIVHNTDCLMSTEPVLIQYEEKSEIIIDYKTVEDISDGNWTRINANKEISKARIGHKIWSDQGFTNIINVVRCGVKKSLSRVLTQIGVVNCSNEHSLLRDNLESVTPLDLKIGEKLCVSELPLPYDTPKFPIYNTLTVKNIEEYEIPSFIFNGLTAELAFVWGLFFADGSCGEYLCNNGYNKTTWAINNQDNKLLEKCRNILIRNENSVSFKILYTLNSSQVNKLIAVQFSRTSDHIDTIPKFIYKYHNLFYDNRKCKKIPSIIFNSPLEIRQSFFMGYYSGDGSKKDPMISLSNKGAIGSAGLFYLMKSIGYQVSVNTITDNLDIYKLSVLSPEKTRRYKKNEVKKIIPIEGLENDYIYDIQTENHHFAAGVGQLVVHNSNYITFPHLKTAEECWNYAEKVAEEVSALFPRPIKLEFEEAIYADFLILTKKRYLHRTCGKDGFVSSKIGKKGVLLSRRDNSMFIRELYEKLIGKVFDRVDREDILYFIIQEINKLLSNSLPCKSFTITKSVGDIGNFTEAKKESQFVIQFKDEKGKIKGRIGSYTVPLLSEDETEKADQLKKKEALTVKEFYEKCLPAQVQLAEKMRRRGARVEAGSRLEYLIIEHNGGHKGKQYEKIESIDYFMDHKTVLKIDFFYYLENMINPVDEVLNVLYNKDDSGQKYKFKKDFIQEQYNFRYKIREKMMNELRDLFRPKLLFMN